MTERILLVEAQGQIKTLTLNRPEVLNVLNMDLLNALKEQITRTSYPSPFFKFARPVNDIDNFKYEDFVIVDYQSHSAVKMDVAV